MACIYISYVYRVVLVVLERNNASTSCWEIYWPIVKEMVKKSNICKKKYYEKLHYYVKDHFVENGRKLTIFVEILWNNTLLDMYIDHLLKNGENCHYLLKYFEK